MSNELLFPTVSTDTDTEEDNQRKNVSTWKVLIVDDEKSIHDVTQLVLKTFEFEHKKINFVHAYSGEEAKKLITDNPDTALILLDVVMENDDAGLTVARFIREELKNTFVRIILRTGQLGSTPEESIIRDYDIHDYKNKTDLTAQKLKTVIYSALRSYRDLLALEKNRVGLKKIIDASSSLFESNQFDQFVSGVLIQLSAIISNRSDSLIVTKDDSVLLAGCELNSDFESCPRVINGTGRFLQTVGKPIEQVLRNGDLELIFKAISGKKNEFGLQSAVFYFSNKAGNYGIIYLPGCCGLDDDNLSLLALFSKNISIAYDNVSLYKEIDDTQSEVIQTLGTIAEFRSKETSQHVNRVALYSEFLAEKHGLTSYESKLIRFASPMHDIGKIGIPDNILQKPGKLTEEEFTVMKTHSKIGYDMLKGSNRPIIKTAAIIAHEHQEKYDGTGYPRGLAGHDIHIYGRVTAVADVFDALGSDRCYKKAWPLDKIVALFQEQKGKHFDPDLTQILLDHIDDFVAMRDSLVDV